MNRILLPRIKHCSMFEMRPSRPVSVTLLSCMFILSSLSTKCPRYTSPVFNSTVMVCPSDSWSSFTGIPMVPDWLDDIREFFTG